MLLIFGYLTLAIVAGIIAGSRGRSGFGYFLLSLVASPLIGIILAAAMPNLRPSIEREAELARSRACPHCAEPIKREASVCRYCGRDVQPIPEVPERKVLRGSLAAAALLILLAILYAVSWHMPAETPQEARTTALQPAAPELLAPAAIAPTSAAPSPKAQPKDAKPKAPAGPLRITPQ